jgi:hypothetical protein
MKCRHNRRLVIAASGAQWFANVTGVAKAVHYVRAAKKDERNGFRYTAAMEWQFAAGLFGSNMLAAEYSWRQWERILHLPRRLAGPISDSRPVLPQQPSSVTHSLMGPSNEELFLPTAA